MSVEKYMDLTYLRGQVVALYKLMANISKAIDKLEEQIKEEEKRKDRDR